MRCSPKLVDLQDGEQIVYQSRVESCSLRRRASKLFPIPPPTKPKIRELILTNRRLLCLKQREKTTQVRSEVFLCKEKEKDPRSLIESVDTKGTKDFVVIDVRLLASYKVC